MSAKLEGIRPVLMANDLGRSAAYYNQLGFQVVFQDRPEDPRYLGVSRDGIVLHLQWHDRSQWDHVRDLPVYRFVVDDVDALFAEFAASGAARAGSNPSPWAQPADTPWGTREFHLRDPDGNGLQFYRPR